MDLARFRLVRQHHPMIIDLETSRKYILGRDIRRNQIIGDNSQFVRCFSEFVSRKHCHVNCDVGGVWKIRDMESMNGTFLNDVKLLPQQQRELRDGDLIGLGINGMGQAEEEIDVRDARYFTFKFEEVRRHNPVLIDLADEDDPDPCVVSAPSHKVPPPQKKPKVSSRSSSKDGPQKVIENAARQSSSRSISPSSVNMGKEKSKKNYPPSSLDLIPSESEDDSSDGCSNDHNIVNIPTTSKKALEEELSKKVSKLISSTSKNEEKSSHKSLQPSNQVSKRKMAPTPLHPPQRIHPYEGAEHSKEFQCFVYLQNMFQVNQHGQVVLCPAVKKKLNSVGCSFSQLPHEDQKINSAGLDATRHSNMKIHKEHEDGLTVAPSPTSNLALVIASVSSAICTSSCTMDISSANDTHHNSNSTDDTFTQCAAEKKRPAKDDISEKGVEEIPPPKKMKRVLNNIQEESESEDEDFDKSKQKNFRLKESKTKTNVVAPNQRDQDGKEKISNGWSKLVEEGRKNSNIWLNAVDQDKMKKIKSVPEPVADKVEKPPTYSKRSSDEETEAMDYDDTPLADLSDDEESEDYAESEATATNLTFETTKEVNQPENDERLNRIVSINRSNTKISQRQIKIIEDAPAPSSFGRRKKGLGTEERISVIPPGAIPSKKTNEWRSDAIDVARKASEERQERKRRLKIAAERQNLKNLESRQDDDASKKHKFVPKVKVRDNTRGTALLQDMVESESSKESSELLANVEPVAGCSKDMPQPRQSEFPTIEEQSKMPLYALLNPEFKKPAVPTAPRPAQTAKVLPSVIRDNLMQKPNAVVSRRSEDRQQEDNNVNKKKPFVGPKSRKVQIDTKLYDDTIYQDISKWNPLWLEEQKKHTDPPEVEKGYRHSWPIVRTLHTYSNYAAYQSTFYPLMLHELWAAISEDVTKNSKLPGYESKISIDDIVKLDSCPFLPQDPSIPKHGVWFQLRCHSYACNRGEIRKELDLCVLKRTRINSKGEEEVFLRPIFAHIMTGQRGSETIEEIKSTTVVNDNLIKLNPNFKLKHSFSMFFHDRHDFVHEISQDRICNIERISYIAPKIRDYRAFVALPKFLLYQNILSPPKIENPWKDSQLEQTNTNLVSYCNPLNPRQKSMINYISKRIMTVKEPDIMLIHGPPGTGKTRTIVGLIFQLVTSQDYKAICPKILVCTPSNTAIDEIVSRVHEILKDMDISKRPRMVRLGESCKKTEIALKYNPEVMARKQMSTNSALDSIQITIQDKMQEIKRKQAERKEAAANNNNIRVKALDREIKEAEGEIASLEKNKREVASTTIKNQEEFNKSVIEIIKGADIVCSTLSSCSSRWLKQSFELFSKPSSLKDPKFTCCIIDEATQTTEPETLAPLMYNIRKLVMVGDPQQLDATVLSKKSRENRYEFSLFHRLYTNYSLHDPNPVMMLKDQYRMHSEILKWPNDYFYGANLLQRPIRKQNSECPLPPYAFFNLCSQESSTNRGEISNEQETNLVIELLKGISVQLSSARDPFTIGVITPYSKQRHVLTEEIKKKAQSVAAIVEVDTVDSFQGREKDIVIISCVRTESFGFLTNPKRLNVALTRAVHSLFIIGNTDFLKTNEMWESLIEDAESRKFLHDIPKDRTHQPTYIAKFFHPILSSSANSEIPAQRRMQPRLGF